MAPFHGSIRARFHVLSIGSCRYEEPSFRSGASPKAVNAAIYKEGKPCLNPG